MAGEEQHGPHSKVVTQILPAKKAAEVAWEALSRAQVYQSLMYPLQGVKAWCLKNKRRENNNKNNNNNNNNNNKRKEWLTCKNVVAGFLII